MNLLELFDNAKKLAAWRVNYAQNDGWNLTQLIPYVGTKTILAQGTCHGYTQENVKHVVDIQFQNIKFFDEPPEQGEYGTIEYKEENYYFIKPTLETDVKIRCSCNDFRFRSSWWAWKQKCIFGGPPKAYKRKTKNRPPVNKLKIPFLCKHLVSFQSYLHVHKYLA